jgi:hypothetical protein
VCHETIRLVEDESLCDRVLVPSGGEEPFFL